MEFIKGMFSTEGNVSLTRVLCFLSFCIGAGLSFKENPNIQLVSLFIGSAIGGKVLGAFVEAKSP